MVEEERAVDDVEGARREREVEGVGDQLRGGGAGYVVETVVE